MRHNTLNRVLVTGASGFIGKVLCDTLSRRGISVVPAVRFRTTEEQFETGDLKESIDWSSALFGCDVVIHLAARVHVMNYRSGDSLRQYRQINVDATVDLARQAVAAGVRRFVYVSSIKVNGEQTDLTPFLSTDVPAPKDDYGISKLMAEQALSSIASLTDLECVIVRPPLVYGPGVGANFYNLMKLVALGLPLPFGSINSNRRSLVSVHNLVDLLIRCCEHPRAVGQTFLVSDGEDLSTCGLVRVLSEGMNKHPFLLPVPASLITAIARIAGMKLTAERLLSSLQVDISPTRSCLDWEPPIRAYPALIETAQEFLRNR
jgi:nucleoside-diphosphate-sugar epimerase